ncbi:hypothetical protein, partial [Citreimonas sp.]|uniref:hypothetical protein n=1 Tax=Citreimonas sp. TaxID=3036715 RepID=UPI0035C85DC6
CPIMARMQRRPAPLASWLNPSRIRRIIPIAEFKMPLNVRESQANLGPGAPTVPVRAGRVSRSTTT